MYAYYLHPYLRNRKFVIVTTAIRLLTKQRISHNLFSSVYGIIVTVFIGNVRMS